MVTKNELDEMEEIRARRAPDDKSLAYRFGRFFWTITICGLLVWLARAIWAP